MRFTAALVAVSSFLTFAPGAHAVVAPDAPGIPEIPLGDSTTSRAHDLFQPETTEGNHARAALEARLETSLGGTWRIPAWNPRTGTPHYVLGSGIETGAAPSTDALAESIARAQLAHHPEVFHDLDPSELRLHAVRRGRGKVAVHFQQLFFGLPVVGARAHLTFTDGGRLFVMGSDLFADIDVDPVPALSPDTAIRLATDALGAGASVAGIDGEPELWILPVPVSESDVTHHLAWRVRVRTSVPVGIWDTYVDAHTRAILWRTNDVHYATFNGLVTSDVQESSYCAGLETTPSAYTDVHVIDVADVVTDATGHWTYESVLPVRGATARLSGPFVDVRNRNGPDAIAVALGDLGPSFDMAFTDRNSARDERDAFAAINEAHDFFETFDPGFPFTNQQIVVNVGQEGSCAAYWDGQIWCFRSGNGCAATGEIQSVVIHELGHGVQTAVIGGQGEQGLGEGNADALANLITNDSVIGRGFWTGQCDIGVRDSDNALRYPEDVVGQAPHSAGRVIAGFHWDVLERLQLELGEADGTREAASLWHYARMLEIPWTQPAQVIAMFIADDDDGNLFNGTTHCAALNTGALAHGFPTFNCELLISHTRLDTRTTGGDVTPIAWLSSLDGEVTYVGLNYTVNRALPRNVEMVDTTGFGVYTATIPNLHPNDSVQYFIFGLDDQQTFVDSPYGAATTGSRHKFDIAAAWFDMEQPRDWQTNADGTDDASTGRWERVAPRPTSVQPGTDHTAAGALCWVTGQQPQGVQGNGVNDVDGGVTRLYSPWFDLSNATLAKIKYWRFFSNNSGLYPNADVFMAEARNNGGGWVPLETTTVSSNQWIQVTYDLVSHFGSALGVVQLRFSVSDDDDPSIVEAAIDDFAILTNVGDPTVAPPAGDGLLSVGQTHDGFFDLGAPRPNPFNPTTSLTYTVATEGPVQLLIFDVSGRLVRTLVDARLASGRYSVTWDATTDHGRRLASGVYYARLRSGSADFVRRLTLAR